MLQPSLRDIHQDHESDRREGLRAFKRTTILGYEIPWNNFNFDYQAYVALEKEHVERSARAQKYESQQHRRYSDPEYIWNVARTHGINVNREYAEVFEVYRVAAEPPWSAPAQPAGVRAGHGISGPTEDGSCSGPGAPSPGVESTTR